MGNLTNKIYQFFIRIAGYLFFIFLGKTARIKIIGQKNYEKLREEKKSFIFLLWHGRMFLPVYLHRRQGIKPLISLSQDGEIAAQIVTQLGYRPIRGSSSHGGREAFREMQNELESYAELAIVPDGPKGPNRVLKSGCLYLAQKTGAYLVPISYSSSRKISLKSWDSFLLFPPFSKCVVLYGEPIKVNPNLDKEEFEKFRKKVEEIMIRLDEKADSYFNKN
ncbi:MAG: lysophospholipid acyltransferase family protein [Candidatus Aminicenantia bacterium]